MVNIPGSNLISGSSEIQTGVHVIGASNDPMQRFTINFNTSFSSPPTVVANTLQGTDYPGPLPDTFAVSIKSISNGSAELQVHRVDANLGWGQNLQLSWVAVVV